MEEGTTYINWMRENLKIKDKETARLIPFYPNLAQRRVWNTMELQASRNLPVRILIAKARQEGVSTLIEAAAFTMINFHPNTIAQVVSADDDSTDLVFSMSKLMQDELPGHIRRPTIRSSRKEIAYAKPHRSKFIVQTAGKDVLGRGGTIQYFHGSEVAYWPHAKEGLIGALQQVPNAAGTIVALESTGNGVGGEFYDRYIRAVDKMRRNHEDYSGYLPVFLAWHTFDKYRMPLPEGYVLKPTEEEIHLQKKYDLSPEQLYWRRQTIDSECGGDETFFKQEYPADWRECFQASGRSVFSQGMLNRLEDACGPGSTCEFVSGEPQVVYRTLNCWTIWNTPHPNHQYTMGIDTMEGIVSDKSNERSDPDLHGVVIYDRTGNEVAAIYYGRGEQRALGKQCLQAAGHYNNAWTGIEIPKGMVVLDVFKEAGYPNLFRRQIHDERRDSDETEELGWRTTTATRPAMVQGLLGFIREHPIKIRSLDLIKEMRTFIWDKMGKAIHQPGEHDDLIFALMIAIQVHLRTEMRAVPYEYATTGAAPEKQRVLSMAYAGGYDTDTDGDDDFDSEYYSECCDFD